MQLDKASRSAIRAGSLRTAAIACAFTLVSCGNGPATVNSAEPTSAIPADNDSAQATSATMLVGTVYQLSVLRSGVDSQNQTCFWGVTGDGAAIGVIFGPEFDLTSNASSVRDDFTGNSAVVGSPIQVLGSRTDTPLSCDGRDMTGFQVSTIGIP